MTTMAELLGGEVDMIEIKDRVVEHFAEVFDRTIVKVESVEIDSPEQHVR